MRIVVELAYLIATTYASEMPKKSLKTHNYIGFDSGS